MSQKQFIDQLLLLNRQKKKELAVVKKILLYLKSFVFDSEDSYQIFVAYLIKNKSVINRGKRKDFVKKFLEENQ